MPEYRRTIFIRFILSYTILSVVLIGIMGGYWYTQANGMMEEEIVKDNQNRLDSAKDYIEQTVLKKYEDNLQSKALSIRFIQNNFNLNLLLNKSWEGNLSRIASLRQDLDFYRIENEGLVNVTVYFPANNYVVDASNFYMMTENAEEAAFILKLNEVQPKEWLFRTLADGSEVMTYVIKLPYETPGVPTKGYFYIDVGMGYLQSAAATMLSSAADRLYIFDRSGRTMLHTGEYDEALGGLLKETIQHPRNAEQIIEDTEGKAVLSYLEPVHSAHEWTYAMYRPMNSFVLSSERLKNGLFASCGAVVLFGLLMSFFFSKQLYLPVKKLVMQIKDLHSSSPATWVNEYVFIGSAFHLMEEKIITLEMQARKNDLKNLLLGASLGLENKDFVQPGYSYCTAHLDNPEEGSECLKMRYETMERTLHSVFVLLNEKEAAVIYYIPPNVTDAEAIIMADLRQLQESAGTGPRFGGAIGSIAAIPEELADSYQMAKQAARYHFLYGRDSIVAYSRILEMNAAPYLFQYEHFKHALQAGNQDAINDFINHFLGVLQEGNMQIEAVELALLQLITQLYQSVIELKLQHFLPHSNIFEELKKDTLADTVEGIRMLSMQIAEHLRYSGNHAHADIIRTLKAYIAGHLHEDISLQILSKEVSLAPAYISTLFSEGTKEAFTEYVTRLRLEKAADLLRSQPRLSVSAIASQVGYRNPQYFHSKFKTRYGVTPVQYRNSQLAALDTLFLDQE
ncbi:AraC family transcriptional regulator [Paenibacillus sp. S150]|uniref:helix-turn-helix domain-containing protein n=1 Tax=Paenibacillus sp. S150 TaxID=2749826 RepID=UPI001C58349B|nr:AraC family transcriptional regulator [Paenibacillus sp. S150]MBW4079789.1 AraC family transcriptional regulator [Paenibacillus sp. S150]